MGILRQPPPKPKTVPSPTNHRTQFLRDDYEWADVGGGNVTLKRAVPGGFTTNTVTGVSTGITFPVRAGKRYLLRGRFLVQSSATTEAVRWRLDTGSTAAAFYTAHLAVVSWTSATGVQGSNANAINTNTAGTNGPGGTSLPVTLDGYMTCTADGTVDLRMVSETGGTVTMIDGALEVVEF